MWYKITVNSRLKSPLCNSMKQFCIIFSQKDSCCSVYVSQRRSLSWNRTLKPGAWLFPDFKPLVLLLLIGLQIADTIKLFLLFGNILRRQNFIYRNLNLIRKMWRIFSLPFPSLWIIWTLYRIIMYGTLVLIWKPFQSPWRSMTVHQNV